MSKTDAALPVDALDLRQLRFLLALLRCGSITQAGEICGMSQPAASRTVARLRTQLGDPLLVRTRSGFALTARAQALESSLDRSLMLLDRAFSPTSFDPARACRAFRLASTDYGVATVAKRLLPRLGTDAPSVSLNFDPWAAQTLDRLEQGKLDFALYTDDAIPAEFHYRTLFKEHYALLGPAVHPLWDRIGPGDVDKAALREASEYPHFAVRYLSGVEHETDDIYRNLELPRPLFRLEVPYFSFGAQVIAEAGLLAILPARVLSSWPPTPQVTVRTVAVESLGFEYRLIWHERAHRDDGCIWLRTLIAQACG
jgi:DNA-binding transcriptional LysR family regulator